MAVKTRVFRQKFPLLMTGSLLALQPVATSIAQAADQFDCRVSASGGWDCSSTPSPTAHIPKPVHRPESATLADIDDASQPQLVTKARGKGLQSRSTDYSHLDWVPRDQLNAAQLAEIGPYCGGSYIEPLRAGINEGFDEDSPTYVSAKVSRYEQEKQVATLAGDVVLRQGSMQVEGDEANLYQTENRGEMVGRVKLRDKGMLIVGDRAEVYLDNGEAQVENAEYVLHDSNTRGSALYAKRQENAVIQLKDGTYTSCSPGSNAWSVKGNNVKLNPATGFGSATNATLRVKNIPVFYTPYIYFPIDDRRQSGFLPPSISSSSDTGFMLVTPYYFNLAPNYDATLYPRYMAKRGLMLEGEFRYLTRSSEGVLGASFLNDREDERKGQPEYTDNRWLYSWKNVSGLDSRWLAEVDFTRISDPYYFQDLDTDLGIGTPTYVNQQGALTYRGDTFSARLNAQAYQLATVSDVTPYDRLPQLTLNGFLPYHPGGLNFNYSMEAVRFDRDLDDQVYYDQDWNYLGSRPDANLQGLARATGNRFHIEPTIDLPMNRSWGYLTPTVKYFYTKYDLDLDSKGKSSLHVYEENFDRSQDRSIGLFKLDGGLYFDRDTQFRSMKFRQTLEPRAMYLYVPYKDQEDIPVFDTSEPSFTYDSLWRENRFTGRDRIGDANQLSLGVTTRFIQENGFERASLSFGQMFYFRDRRVQLPGLSDKDLALARSRGYDVSEPDNDSSRSPYALAGIYRYNRDWMTIADYSWNPNSHETEAGSLMFHYQPAANPNKILNFGYRYRQDIRRFNEYTGRFEYARKDDRIKQHDFSVLWPIVRHWSAIARWQYDYNQSRTLEAFGGFEYDSCCWKARLITRYWVDDDDDFYRTTTDSDRGVFLQIVLKGLGGIIGGKVDGFLDQGIQGYRYREDQAK